jgi:hypothetical protein
MTPIESGHYVVCKIITVAMALLSRDYDVAPGENASAQNQVGGLGLVNGYF